MGTKTKKWERNKERKRNEIEKVESKRVLKMPEVGGGGVGENRQRESFLTKIQFPEDVLK
jgi:hypothetical protein